MLTLTAIGIAGLLLPFVLYLLGRVGLLRT
jgi:hypothetical protein